MKNLFALFFCALFLFSCASSKQKAEKATLDDTKEAAESAVKQVHELQIEKAKLEAAKGDK